MEAFLKVIESLFILDTKTLAGVLIWGDLALALLSYGYNKFHYTSDGKEQIKVFGLAKFIQSIAWLLVFLRGDIPDVLSIYAGNILLYLSFYFESVVMLNMIKNSSSKWYKLQKTLLAIAVVIFVLFEIIWGQPSIRITVSSFSIIGLLVVPSIFYTFSSQSTLFKQYLGIYILVFLFFLTMRGIQSIFTVTMDVFKVNLIHSLTFINLILLMFINGAGFLLLMYEEADILNKANADLHPLTLLHNRRYFMTKAEAYFERSKKAEKPLAFLFLDIDHFKKVNDEYGHQFGDEVLKDLSKIVQESIRPMDLCCRYGGEEFLILLHEANEEQAIIVGERIREMTKKSSFALKNDFSYTVSIGVYSSIPKPECQVNMFIDLSDQAMYLAKTLGRNRAQNLSTSQQCS